MTKEELQNSLLKNHNLRITPAMSGYILSRLNAGGEIPIIGGDARTGVAIQTTFPAELLAATQSAKASLPET